MKIWKRIQSKFVYRLMFVMLLTQIVYQSILYVTFWADVRRRAGRHAGARDGPGDDQRAWNRSARRVGVPAGLGGPSLHRPAG